MTNVEMGNIVVQNTEPDIKHIEFCPDLDCQLPWATQTTQHWPVSTGPSCYKIIVVCLKNQLASC